MVVCDSNIVVEILEVEDKGSESRKADEVSHSARPELGAQLRHKTGMLHILIIDIICVYHIIIILVCTHNIT